MAGKPNEAVGVSKAESAYTNLPIHLVGNQKFGLVEFFGIVAIAGLGVEVEDAKQMAWFVGF
jgi:hypothetical protein